VVSVSWRQAASIAAIVELVAFGLRYALPRRRIIADVLRESGILFALYALWQFVLDLTVTSTAGAVAHGRWLWRVERTFRLPSERVVQRSILPTGWLVTLLNRYYLGAHYGAVLVCLAWVFLFRRPKYPWCRRMLVLTTAMLTVPFQSIPVAPPRLIPWLGVVDTAHPSTPALLAGLHDPGQLTAMPSVHVAWAVLVAVFVISLTTGPWRWFVVVYPALTMMVVVWTGNHFWADGIVGAGIVAVAVVAARLVRPARLIPSRTRSAPSRGHPEAGQPVHELPDVAVGPRGSRSPG
jgi:hypothetical protein